MPRRRDYAAEYARRQQKAREAGFSSYHAQRAAKEKQKTSLTPYQRRVARARARGFSSPYAEAKHRRAVALVDRVDPIVEDRPRYSRRGTQRWADDQPDKKLRSLLGMNDDRFATAVDTGEIHYH